MSTDGQVLQRDATKIRMNVTARNGVEVLGSFFNTFHLSFFNICLLGYGAGGGGVGVGGADLYVYIFCGRWTSYICTAMVW